MAIRPIDVRRKEFGNSFRGYEANQVDDFLDQVADEFERAYTDNQRMREEVSSLRERLQQFEELEGSIRSALVHAEQAANDLRNTSQREADDLRHSAQREAESLRDNSQREAESLRASSQREAELTIQEAQARAHQMLSDSSGRVERVQDSYEALQEAKQEFTRDFRQLLKTYMDVMEDMEISSAKGIESSLRQRLDTESIAVAREAANSDQPELTEEYSGPLYEDEESEENAAFESDSSSEQTQRINLEDLPDRDETPEGETPEAEEPEVEPSSAESDPDSQETMVSDSTANGLERDERRDDSAYSESDREKTNADDFFEDDREEGSYDKEAEEEEDNRIFRASRFLRRRG